jgi:hypothetical protein
VSSAPVALLLALIFMAPSPTAAAAAGVPGSTGPTGYGCAPVLGGIGLAMEASAIEYGVAGGVSGVAWGLDATMGSGRVSGQVGYQRITLRRTTTSPHALRASLRMPVAVVGGWSLCGVGHAGGTRWVADAGQGTVLAGGIGLSLYRAVAIGGATVVPFDEARGLGARGTGTALDVDMDATGLSFGVEAGASIPLGRLELRLTGSMDGFAAGLGVTPYPDRSLRVAMGYRF